MNLKKKKEKSNIPNWRTGLASVSLCLRDSFQLYDVHFNVCTAQFATWPYFIMKYKHQSTFHVQLNT